MMSVALSHGSRELGFKTASEPYHTARGASSGSAPPPPPALLGLKSSDLTDFDIFPQDIIIW